MTFAQTNISGYSDHVTLANGLQHSMVVLMLEFQFACQDVLETLNVDKESRNLVTN